MNLDHGMHGDAIPVIKNAEVQRIGIIEPELYSFLKGMDTKLSRNFRMLESRLERVEGVQYQQPSIHNTPAYQHTTSIAVESKGVSEYIE